MKIYRKRYIPNEIIDISGDKVEFVNEDLLITNWLSIHPRNDVAFGMSYAYLKRVGVIANIITDTRIFFIILIGAFSLSVISQHLEDYFSL